MQTKYIVLPNSSETVGLTEYHIIEEGSGRFMGAYRISDYGSAERAEEEATTAAKVLARVLNGEVGLKEGTYRLASDVANPKPDRRANQHHARSWRSHVTWKQGMVFIVTPNPDSPSLRRIYLRDGYKMDAVMERLDQEAFDVLASALERIEEEPSDLLVRLEDSLAGQYALRMLDKIGLSEKKVRELIEEIENEWAAENEKES